MKTNAALTFAASAARLVYLPLVKRIRHWGALPAPRGPTVLITNHQHEDEGEVIFASMFLEHPDIPMIAVNSRRTFETGFFAARLPWTAPFTRKLNASGFWMQVGLLPIENHLHSRALISLAEEARAKHGDVTLETIFADDVVAQLGLTGTKLGDLWRPAAFARAQTVVKLASLKQPYRREALENFRATMTADIAAVVEAVREGATFYVTPEGDFSHDGFMRPMRNGLTDAVLPVAEPWLCAIAYDPFRGNRLSMLYRIVQPANAEDLGASLAAARAITTTMLATFLCGIDAPFTAADARANVKVQLAALPEGVFVDPELTADPGGAVTEALAVLVRLGTLAADGPKYRLTDKRTDARFPHIADIVTYHRNMLEETLASGNASRVTPVIALLRAVNVGGTGKLAMADLTKLLTSLRFTGVKTLLQSGNVVFLAPDAADAALEAKLEAAVEKKFGLKTAFYVRTAREWDVLIAKNPYPEAAHNDPGHTVVMTFKGAPKAADIAALQAAVAGNETVKAIGKQAYFVYPDGIGTSKLTNALIERKLGMSGTARNWNTVLKLQAAAAALRSDG